MEELRAELQAKKERLKDTNARIKELQDKIQTEKSEARTLEDQIGVLDRNADILELEITRTIQEIDATKSEIGSVEREIEDKEEQIAAQKRLLGEYIRAMHNLDQQSGVTVFLKYQTFSEAVSEAATIEELQSRGQQTLFAILELRKQLEDKKHILEDFKQTLEELHARQEHQQQTLENQIASKQRILDLTNAQEAQYQTLLKEAQSAHKAAESEIRAIDAAIREELRKQGLGNLPSVGTMEWPVDPIFGVSCEFHCGGYPYAYLIGPHSGIDIPTYLGTPVKAAADGYVARVHDSGDNNYSYLMILHGDNVTTVYGHLSGFAVNEGQMVTRGQIVGYSGGIGRGAGLSTGAHLHFEVRSPNPVNPRKYLS